MKQGLRQRWGMLFALLLSLSICGAASAGVEGGQLAEDREFLALHRWQCRDITTPPTTYTGTWALLELPDFEAARRPALAAALQAYNEEVRQEAAAQREEMVKEWQLFQAENGSEISFTYEGGVFVQRADAQVLSLLRHVYFYRGGNHGYYGVMGYNFDVAAGRRLALGDVFADLEQLKRCIELQLRRDYGDSILGEDEFIAQVVSEQVREGTLAWTLQPSGAAFYFNPYVLSGYLQGVLMVTIRRDEYPELFRADATADPACYAMELCPGVATHIPFSNGTASTLRVWGGAAAIHIEGDGFSFVDDRPCRDDAEGVRFTLLALGAQRLLYADCAMPEGGREIRVYALLPDGVRSTVRARLTGLLQPAEMHGGAAHWSVITDPQRVLLKDDIGGDGRESIAYYRPMVADGWPEFLQGAEDIELVW